MNPCTNSVRLLLALVFSLAAESGQIRAQKPPSKITVGKLPKNLKLDPFYEKYADAENIPVVSSKRVPDKALVQVVEVVGNMLTKRPDLRKALVKGNARISVMSKDEVTTDIPEHSNLMPKDFWDKRARGVGGVPTSCAEENLLGYKDDRYNGENILIHEFAHTIHEVGMKILDPEFDNRLEKLFDAAIKKGLWKKTYAATDFKEYWAEGVQSFFDANMPAERVDGIHNGVRTREQLKKYDPDLSKLVDEVFAKNPWQWVPNGAHADKWKK